MLYTCEQKYKHTFNWFVYAITITESAVKWYKSNNYEVLRVVLYANFL